MTLLGAVGFLVGMCVVVFALLSIGADEMDADEMRRRIQTDELFDKEEER